MERTILLAAHPRSGSSWICSLIDSHPDVTKRHEPIARLSEYIDDELLDALKYNNGISDNQYKKIISVIYSPFVETDRPPFFPKSHSNIAPGPHIFLWMLCSKIQILAPLYRKLISKLSGCEKFVVLKETGWCRHLPSIIAGLNPFITLFLLRHPCGYVDSVLRGFKQNHMLKRDSEIRKKWYEVHKYQPAIEKLGLNESNVLLMDEMEYLALKWRVFAELTIDYSDNNPETTEMLIYEKIQANPVDELSRIFSKFGLEMSLTTYKFLEESRTSSYYEIPLSKKDSGSEYYSVYRDKDLDVEKWKKNFSAVQIQKIKSIAGEEYILRFWEN